MIACGVFGQNEPHCTFFEYLRYMYTILFYVAKSIKYDAYHYYHNEIDNHVHT